MHPIPANCQTLHFVKFLHTANFNSKVMVKKPRVLAFHFYLIQVYMACISLMCPLPLVSIYRSVSF